MNNLDDILKGAFIEQEQQETNLNRLRKELNLMKVLQHYCHQGNMGSQ